MSKIVFFSIPAHGHTNPTIPVVAELVKRGHHVWYYSFREFREKIEGAGAVFIECDGFLPGASQKEVERKAGKDFAALIEMIADMTIAMDEKVCRELKEIQPDCIVADSLCLWGKLFAKKSGVPYISSTTSFAFNRHTAKLMKRRFTELWRMIVGMPRINKKIGLLRKHGYDVKNFVSMIENDNDTDTIVYTSREFQPMADTFSDRYAFVGPSISQPLPAQNAEQNKNIIYVSLGTVLNRNQDFYKSCIRAFAQTDYEVVMSVGEKTEISSLGSIPGNITVAGSVDQLAVLQTAAVFITHCGMNSVNESLYFGVPLVLFPQHSEQRLIADRVAEMGAGVMLKGTKPKDLAAAAAEVLTEPDYKENAQKLAESLRNAGGAAEAANKILGTIVKQAHLSPEKWV